MSELISSTCLAVATILGEAGGEPHAGKVAVGIVIRNRMKLKYASDGTVAGTVLRPLQFSLYNHSEADRRLLVRVCKTDDMDQTAQDCFRAWAESGDDQARALHWGKFDKAVLYHAESVSPNWSARVTLVDKVGRHLFYEDPTT